MGRSSSEPIDVTPAGIQKRITEIDGIFKAWEHYLDARFDVAPTDADADDDGHTVGCSPGLWVTFPDDPEYHETEDGSLIWDVVAVIESDADGAVLKLAGEGANAYVANLRRERAALEALLSHLTVGQSS